MRGISTFDSQVVFADLLAWARSLLMRRQHQLGLVFFIANLMLVLMFPPHDYVSLQRGNIPTFDGFYFAMGSHPNRVVNADFLALEIIVVLVNSAIAWLLLRKTPNGLKSQIFGNRQQRRILMLVAANLFFVLLFPPFENYLSITKAALPTFEGFYFIFGDNSQRQLVTPVLYIEVALLLINGGLFWLLFKDKQREEISPEQMRALAKRVRASQTR